MANTVFNKETLLDLLVNGIPLFILLFFVGVFIAAPVFGFGGIETGLQFGIVVVSFVALAILSYVVGKAVTLAEENGTVYMPGQATVEGSKPLEEREEALEESKSEETAGELTEDDVDEDADSTEGEAAEDVDMADEDAEVATEDADTDAEGASVEADAAAEEEPVGADTAEEESVEADADESDADENEADADEEGSTEDESSGEADADEEPTSS